MRILGSPMPAHQAERVVVGPSDVDDDLVADRQDRADALDQREVEIDGVADDGESGDLDHERTNGNNRSGPGKRPVVAAGRRTITLSPCTSRSTSTAACRCGPTAEASGSCSGWRQGLAELGHTVSLLAPRGSSSEHARVVPLDPRAMRMPGFDLTRLRSGRRGADSSARAGLPGALRSASLHLAWQRASG